MIINVKLWRNVGAVGENQPLRTKLNSNGVSQIEGANRMDSSCQVAPLVRFHYVFDVAIKFVFSV